jgi:Dna[CI] antecedent, DciA
MRLPAVELLFLTAWRWTRPVESPQTMNEGACLGNRKQLFIYLYLTMSDPLKPLATGLGGAFEQLARRAEATATLATRVGLSLPEELRAHVVGAARRGDDLVVLVDSAAWSARVRYAGAALRERLEALGEPVAGKVRVRVARRKRMADGG